MLVDVADGDKVDARGAPVELVHDLEIAEYLLDLRCAMQLVVRIETGAGVLELDLGVEDDVGGDGIGRQQHQTVSVGAVLPLPVCSRILQRAVFELAIGAEAQTRHGSLG